MYECKPSFLSLLEAHIQLDATEPHDKIYALLGLAEMHGLPYSDTLEFNYNDPVIASVLGYPNQS